MIKKDFNLKLNGKTLAIIDWANVYGWNKSLKWSIDVKKLFEYLSSFPEVFDKRLYYGIETGKAYSEEFNAEALQTGFNVISKEVKFIPVSLDKSHFKKIIKELFDVLDNIKIANSDIASKLYKLKETIETRLGEEDPDFDIGDDGQQHIIGTTPSYAKKDGEIYNNVYELINTLDEELKKLNINITELQGNLSQPVLRRKCDFDVEIARDVFNLTDGFNQLILFSGDGDYAALVKDLISKGKKVIVVFASGHKGKEYEEIKQGLYLCSVEQLKNYLALENNIPVDFSTGRDVNNIANL
jgi:uncharacterized LabA/DUF88 family protein